jgi:membrane fusion protein, multidrug efflux system
MQSKNQEANTMKKSTLTDTAESNGKAIALVEIPKLGGEKGGVSEDIRQHPLPPAKAKKRNLPIVLLILGVGAIAGSHYGYNYWQYASSHQETDNAIVAGHIYPVSTRINGTVAEVLVKENQIVKKGQLLVKLDPRDYEIKVQQAQAALETAQRQAEAAHANIALSSETTDAKTTQAQGDISSMMAAIATSEATLREAEAGVSNSEALVTEAQAGIPQAQAKVMQAEAGIPQAQAKVTEAQAGIAGAQAQLAQAEANLEKTQADYARYQGLEAEGAIARQQLDSAKAAYEVALAQKRSAQEAILQAKARLSQAQQGVNSAQAELTQAQEGVKQAQAKVAQTQVGVISAQARVSQAQEGVKQAQAKLEASKGGLQQVTATKNQTTINRSQYDAAQSAIGQAQVALKDAQLQLSYTNIIAATDGKIGKKNVEIGQRIQPGSPLMAIVGNELWVVANFKETQLEKMKPGQKVEIKLDAFPHQTFEGKLDSFSPASGAQFSLLPPDNATGNFTKIVQRVPVKVFFNSLSLNGYESRISPGMSAIVNVQLQ